MNILKDVYITEIIAHKWSPSAKRLKKRKLLITHRGTNFKKFPPKPGFKRVKVGKFRYIYKRLTPKQKVATKRVANAIRKFHK